MRPVDVAAAMGASLGMQVPFPDEEAEEIVAEKLMRTKKFKIDLSDIPKDEFKAMKKILKKMNSDNGFKLKKI